MGLYRFFGICTGFCLLTLYSCGGDSSGSGSSGSSGESDEFRISCSEVGGVSPSSYSLTATDQSNIVSFFDSSGSYGEVFIANDARVSAQGDINTDGFETTNFIVFRQSATTSASDDDLKCAAKYAQHFFDEHLNTLGLTVGDLNLGANKFYLQVTDTATGSTGFGYPFGLSVAENVLDDDEIVNHEVVHTIESIYVLNGLNSHTGHPTSAQSEYVTPEFFNEGLAMFLANQNVHEGNSDITNALQGCNNNNPIYTDQSFPYSSDCQSFDYYAAYRRVFVYADETLGHGKSFIKSTWDYLIANTLNKGDPDGDGRNEIQNFPDALDAGTSNGTYTDFESNFFQGQEYYKDQ